MGRRRRRSHHGKHSGGALSSLRGGFKSTVHSVTGSSRSSRPTSPLRRAVSNIITVALLVVAAALLLRRFGVIHK